VAGPSVGASRGGMSVPGMEVPEDVLFPNSIPMVMPNGIPTGEPLECTSVKAVPARKRPPRHLGPSKGR